MSLPSCTPVSFATPNQFILQGLLFGGAKATTGYIFIHGLTASVFSRLELIAPLANDTTQVLYFNNRGHDKIADIKQADPANPGSYTSQEIGAAHEVFTDCADDVQGAINFLESQGVQDITLVGHSTGCQKSVYYLSQTSSKSVKQVVLLCPMSDYAYAKATTDPKVLAKAANVATKLVEAGKPHELMPHDAWPELYDAQRFLSLYTPDAIEEIFCYAQPGKVPKLLQAVTIPIPVVLAGEDEARDRPMKEIADWFLEVLQNDHSQVKIIPEATHNLTGEGEELISIIKKCCR